MTAQLWLRMRLCLAVAFNFSISINNSMNMNRDVSAIYRYYLDFPLSDSSCSNKHYLRFHLQKYWYLFSLLFVIRLKGNRTYFKLDLIDFRKGVGFSNTHLYAITISLVSCCRPFKQSLSFLYLPSEMFHKGYRKYQTRKRRTLRKINDISVVKFI